MPSALRLVDVLHICGRQQAVIIISGRYAYSSRGCSPLGPEALQKKLFRAHEEPMGFKSAMLTTGIVAGSQKGKVEGPSASRASRSRVSRPKRVGHGSRHTLRLLLQGSGDSFVALLSAPRMRRLVTSQIGHTHSSKYYRERSRFQKGMTYSMPRYVGDTVLSDDRMFVSDLCKHLTQTAGRQYSLPESGYARATDVALTH